MNTRAIIIDDEEMARTLLTGLISLVNPTIQVVATCHDLPSGVKAIRKLQPDLVFLDIEMPGHSGLELLDFFNEEEINFSIIFVTAYNRYAIQAFKLSAVDYLLKPIDEDDLKTALSIFEKRKKIETNYNILKENIQNVQKKIALHSSNSLVFVELSQILYFQAEGAYTQVVLKNEAPILVSKGVKYFETLLAEHSDFFRCHKSYLVNIQYITEYVKSNGGYLIIDKSHEISLSSEKIQQLLKKLEMN